MSSMPSRPGRFLSARTQPNPSCSIRAKASSAFLAVRTVIPLFPSTRLKRSSTTGSSSTTRTVEENGVVTVCIGPQTRGNVGATARSLLPTPLRQLRYTAAMLRANQAVRLGLRAASRNPELSFGKALLDEAGSLLALLPVVLAVLLVVGTVQRGNVLAALRALRGVGWSAFGGMAAALAIVFTLAMLFWAGALPLLAADAELGRRPPAGNFAVLLSRGAARVLAAGALAWSLLLLFNLACVAALLLAAPLCVLHPSPALFVLTALIGASTLTGSVLVDLLARLTLVRAAAFGNGASAALGKASSLFASRLGACLVVTVAFLFLEMIAATVTAMLTGLLPGAMPLDPRAELLALAPRLAIGLAA